MKIHWYIYFLDLRFHDVHLFFFFAHKQQPLSGVHEENGRVYSCFHCSLQGLWGRAAVAFYCKKHPSLFHLQLIDCSLEKHTFGGGVDGPRGSLKFSALVWVNVATQLVWSYQTHIGFHLFKHFTAKRIEKKQKSKFATLVFPFSLNTRNINHLQTPKGSVVAD